MLFLIVLSVFLEGRINEQGLICLEGYFAVVACVIARLIQDDILELLLHLHLRGVAL